MAHASFDEIARECIDSLSLLSRYGRARCAYPVQPSSQVSLVLQEDICHTKQLSVLLHGLIIGPNASSCIQLHNSRRTKQASEQASSIAEANATANAILGGLLKVVSYLCPRTLACRWRLPVQSGLTYAALLSYISRGRPITHQMPIITQSKHVARSCGGDKLCMDFTLAFPDLSGVSAFGCIHGWAPWLICHSRVSISIAM